MLGAESGPSFLYGRQVGSGIDQLSYLFDVGIKEGIGESFLSQKMLIIQIDT